MVKQEDYDILENKIKILKAKLHDKQQEILELTIELDKWKEMYAEKGFVKAEEDVKKVTNVRGKIIC